MVQTKRWFWAAAIAAALGGVLTLAAPVWRAEAGREERTAVGWVPALPGPVLAVAPYRPGQSPLVGTSRGIYRLEAENRWRKVFSPGIFGRPVHAIGSSGRGERKLWLAAGTRFYCSEDGGVRWRPGFRAPAPVLCAAADPGQPSRLLIGTAKGLFESLDGGVSGRPTGQGIPAVRVSGLQFLAGTPPVCVALSDRGLFRSSDGGRSWSRETALSGMSAGGDEPPQAEEGEEEPEELPPTGSELLPALAADPARGLLYASTGREIFRSGDGGNGWQPLPSEGLGFPVETIAVSGADGRLLAASSSGLYLYEEGSERWRLLGDGRPQGRVHDLEPAGGSFCWVGTDQGLFRVRLPEEAEAGFEEAKPEEGKSGPTIQQVQRVVASYAEVGPEKVRNWRALSRLRAFVPSLTLSLDQDRDTNIASSTTGGVTRFTVGPEDRSRSLDFGFTWDLGDLLFSPDQTSIDVRSRLTTQLRQDLLEEATRIYFERKRLIAEFEAQPTEDKVLREERSLRVAELTAYLDALTGGWYSRQLD